MKAKLLFFISLLLPITVFAQSEHLAFKGIPIDGTLRQFTALLTQKGFTKIGSEKGVSMLVGDFAGYKDCSVIVSTMEKQDLVYMVAVKFPNLDTWSLLESNYTKLKNMLTQKYGNPSSCVEKFQHNYVNDDSERLFELQMDRCEYKTVFDTEKGKIALTICNERFSSCYVLLGYVDGINGAIMNDAAMDDL